MPFATISDTDTAGAGYDAANVPVPVAAGLADLAENGEAVMPVFERTIDTLDPL